MIVPFAEKKRGLQMIAKCLDHTAGRYQSQDFNTVDPPYPWVLHLRRIQPTLDGKFFF